jgi:hypothetical protein
MVVKWTISLRIKTLQKRRTASPRGLWSVRLSLGRFGDRYWGQVPGTGVGTGQGTYAGCIVMRVPVVLAGVAVMLCPVRVFGLLDQKVLYFVYEYVV